ncbi:MAG: prenyltransferase/squalene oxidase repeat-containing protein [Isosphaeraceae bacterium]
MTRKNILFNVLIISTIVFESAGLSARRASGQDSPRPGASALASATPSDRSVARGLAYLKGAQKPDGSWESGGFGRATSVTSLAVMAFLAAGHVPGEPGPYRDSVERGIRYVLDHQRADGMLVSNTSHGPMYCHGISTLMLAEVVGMIGEADPALAARSREALTKAVKLILMAQNLAKSPENAGGWRYQPTSRDSDLSVSGWQLMALRAAKSAGLAVPSTNIDRAIDYLKRCAVPGGGFAYQPGQSPNNPRTGTGVLALEVCGAHDTPEAIAGAEYLLKHPPHWSSPYFFYEVYYCPLAMFRMGDAYFTPYYPKMVAILLERQDRDGSWLSGDGNDRSGGRNYCTAMALLALAVEYRYLPIYQR